MSQEKSGVAARQAARVAEALGLGAAAPDGAGFLLADLAFAPILMNDMAGDILDEAQHPSEDGVRRSIQQRIRSILQAERFTTDVRPTAFESAGQRYTCRPVLVENGRRPPMVALLLERSRRDPLDSAELTRLFHLSRRECETVRYLIDGLTTKEVAKRMGVSPNTVKQFIRLIMTKMVVSTRSGIIGKLMTAGTVPLTD